MTEVTSGMGSQGAGLAKLREPFPAHQISKLPKPTKEQTQIVKDDFRKGIRCKVCGGWHHPDVIHLDYVGHAALTDRLLDADPHWTWEPFAVSENGLPALDGYGGLWIKLTVCGVTRIGYGHAGDKEGGDAIKEAIGDALRNSAMRGGAALELWHKGDLHAEPAQPKGVVAAVLATTPKEEAEQVEAIAEQEYYGTLAENVTQIYNTLGPVKALARVDMENLDNDQKIKLWGWLDSKVRSGLKQAGELKRAEKAKA